MITGVIKNKIDKIWTDIRNCFYFLSIELQNQFVIFFLNKRDNKNNHESLVKLEVLKKALMQECLGERM